jgi:hypothetical protein
VTGERSVERHHGGKERVPLGGGRRRKHEERQHQRDES